MIVANGAEGEPASGKDRLLLLRAPHLVLDGLSVAAAALGARRTYVFAPSDATESVQAAINERRRAGLDGCSPEVVPSGERFLSGQESAVVNALNGRTPAIPSFVGLRSIRERGVAGRPTLVQNVETLAHVGLISRYGPDWFRSVGTAESPGTALLTITGWQATPQIVEVPLGGRLGELLDLGPEAGRHIQGVLMGGYGGGWIPTSTALSMRLDESAARSHGSSIGAGVVVLLPTGLCPLVEVARTVRYLTAEGAGQCGPCVNGLDVIATAVERLAFRPQTLHGANDPLPYLCGLVEGRGACRHPDGVARFTRTALDVFEDHTALHRRFGGCAPQPPFLPIPVDHARMSR